MPAQAEMEVMVKLRADASKLKKEAEGILSTIDTGIGGAGGGVGKGAKESSKMLGGMAKGLGKILGLVANIFAGLSISIAIVKVFEPVMKVASQMLRMIAEFVRPVSDMLMILFVPILSIIKPILKVFRTLMAPFRAIAFKGMGLANQLIGKGMKEGGAAGAKMVEVGMLTSISSATLLFSGIIKTLFSWVPGANIVIKKITNSALQGIAMGEMFLGVMNNLSESFRSSLTAQDVDLIITSIREIVQGISKEFGGLNLDNFKSILDDIKKRVPTVTKAMKSLLQGQKEELEAIFKDLGLEAEQAKEKIDNIVKEVIPPEGIVDTRTVNADILNTDVLNTGGEPGKAGAAGEEGAGTSWLGRAWDWLKETGTTIGSDILNLLKWIFVDMPVTVLTESFNLLSGLFNNTFGAKGVMPTNMSASMDTMNTSFLNTFDKEKGKVPTSFNSSLKTMEGSMSNFSSSAGKVSTIVQDATSKVDKYATAYYSAMNRIEAMAQEKARKNKRR